MRRRLEDMVVVITGASSGIGRSVAERLAGRGAKLVLAARRSERLESISASLGGGHLCVRTDVSDPAQCQHLIRASVERFGRIDTLVCNAGYGLIRPVADTSAEDILRLVRTNLIGTTECSRAALRWMPSQQFREGLRGQIVVVSSAAARRGLPDFGAYTATKAAQLSVAEAMRVELRGTGIAVTTVHPVTTDTEFFRAAIRLSRARPPRRRGIEAFQSADAVAASITRAIERPRPEVWPHRRFRLLMGLAVFAPRVADSIVAERRRRQSRRAGAIPVPHLRPTVAVAADAEPANAAPATVPPLR